MISFPFLTVGLYQEGAGIARKMAGFSALFLAKKIWSLHHGAKPPSDFGECLGLWRVGFWGGGEGEPELNPGRFFRYTPKNTQPPWARPRPGAGGGCVSHRAHPLGR